ncbi:FBP domain-containing protein [Homoserinibacter sp. GY 40078]|uniref:FBP domain-containing protein n=1 Tax=Homoserinibacter sp. GY 40078 TaxID=2603275 RepID=UPI0011C70388|nr:FBP domain-containing protein [Homoserinibacter sp. GY 40078]TXK19123.1 FBP domain-containing protein [Homoserinibacter sp. GY 40078]
MHALSESAIRGSFINASLRERQNLLLPPDFGSLDWERIDYLGWRDRKSPQLGYVVAELDGEPVGLLMRQAEARPRARAQCSWCEDVQLPNDVVLFTTKRAGAAGRKGDTLGTLVCAEFQCSANVRKRPTLAYVGFDLDAERERRITALREHVAGFVRNAKSER